MPLIHCPGVCIEIGNCQRLESILVIDTQDVIPPPPRNLKVCPINTEGKVFVCTASLALGRNQIGMVLEVTVVRSRIIASAEDSGVATVAARLGRIAA